MDEQNWRKYHEFFNENRELFRLVHLEEVNGIPYVFSHAGLTFYWIHKVNTCLWHLPDNKVSIADPSIIERINQLDDDESGQNLLSVVGRYRYRIGEKTGSVLWADIEEHSLTDAPDAYGLNQVYQIFGHSKLKIDMIALDNLALIDSQQCFIIDERLREKLVTVRKYELQDSNEMEISND